MKKKILVVDDAYSILDALSIILGNKGYAVETNLSGKKLFKDGNYRPDPFRYPIIRNEWVGYL